MARSSTTFQKGHKFCGGSNKGNHWKIKDTSKMHHPAWNKDKKGLQISWLKGKRGYKNRGTFKSGEGHHNWKGGIYPEHLKIRESLEYQLWRESIFQRDNWTCQFCLEKKKIVAHHIFSFAQYPELRFAINNGMTLCRSCHIKIHKNYEKNKFI